MSFREKKLRKGPLWQKLSQKFWKDMTLEIGNVHYQSTLLPIEALQSSDVVDHKYLILKYFL